MSIAQDHNRHSPPPASVSTPYLPPDQKVELTRTGDWGKTGKHNPEETSRPPALRSGNRKWPWFPHPLFTPLTESLTVFSRWLVWLYSGSTVPERKHTLIFVDIRIAPNAATIRSVLLPQDRDPPARETETLRERLALFCVGRSLS